MVAQWCRSCSSNLPVLVDSVLHSINGNKMNKVDRVVNTRRISLGAVNGVEFPDTSCSFLSSLAATSFEMFLE